MVKYVKVGHSVVVSDCHLQDIHNAVQKGKVLQSVRLDSGHNALITV